MGKPVLAFLPTWGIGHLISTVETAKRLLHAAGSASFSVTVLVMPAPSPVPGSTAAIHSFIQSAATSGIITFQNLPPVDPPSPDEFDGAEDFISLYIQSHRSNVKSALSSSPNPVAALVVDFFATTMIDVAADLAVPIYLFFTSGASMLAFHLHLPTLHQKIPVEFEEMEEFVEIPGLPPVPPLSMPSPVMSKQSGRYTWFVYHGRRFREFRGIIVNTFSDLERSPLAAIAAGLCVPDYPTPPVFPVGPVLALAGDPALAAAADSARRHECVTWLDGQPAGSVVFLCFGSKGSFDVAQAREVALGLEKSGHRFLWCLRVQPPAAASAAAEVLPEGFVGRTEGRGMVWMTWVPQAEILAHPAVGGFVTHCGWNSCLESVWFGVPMLGWPMYAEQHLNAFVMAAEMGVAAALAMDRRRGGFVGAEELERGVRCLMEDCEEGNRVRARVAEMKAASRKATADGGSSFVCLERLAREIIKFNKGKES